MVWTRQTFLEDLGLAPQSHKPYSKRRLRLSKGEVDPRSNGGIVILSDSNLDKEGLIKDLDIRYWVIFPDGRFERQYIFQIETERRKGRIDIKSAWVLGREISLHSQENIDNVMEAIRRIHVSLRDTKPEVPNVAKIFKDCCLEDIIGESLPLPGFNLEHRILFAAAHNFNIHAKGKKKPEMALPSEALLPLMGARVNTLDTDHSYVGRDFIRARGVIPQVGKRFEITSEIVKGDKRKSVLNIWQKAADDIDTHSQGRIMARVQMKRDKAGKKHDLKTDSIYVKNLQILGQNILRRGFHESMGALGVLNLTHTDMLNARDYPRMQDHLALYGLLDTAQSSSNPPPKTGRFVKASIGGNNLREIYPGVGKDIGGNCKMVETQWIDDKTKDTRRLGAVLDFGTYLIKKQSNWTAAHPDVVDKLKYCHDIFITHHHLDHIDALVPYVKRGLIGRNHTLHMTPEVFEMANDKLNKMGVKKDDPRRPRFNLLEGTGTIDLRDENGIIRMTVMYGVDAVPHSAKDTPFIAYGRDGDEILGSYMYLGDMRYDEDWFEITNSPFWDPEQFMLGINPRLNPEHLVPTYTEIDATSVKREGRGASERDVEKNISHIIRNWFFDKHVGAAIIGTNDGRRETLLRIANTTGRKMTAFGSAVELLFRIANKWGVNPYRLERPETGKYTGIEDFLRWHAEKQGGLATEFAGRTSQKVRDWFESDPPGSILAVLSGSQGNPIEFESMTYKLADRRSFWDADPKHTRTARPADLEDWMIIFSQGAIPGNGDYQRTLIKRLAERGAVVLESFDDNLRIHNPGNLKERILADLAQQGHIKKGLESEHIEADGSIFVENMSIHASGHGRKDDMKLWLRKLKAKFFGLHHTDDKESVNSGYDTIEQEGKKHPGDIFENGIEVEITTDSVSAIGKSLTSVVLTRENMEPGKHYNKTLDAMRILVFDDRSPHHDLGLRSSVGGFFETHFGTEDVEEARKRQESKHKATNVIPFPSNKVRAKPPRPYKALERIVTPPWPEPEVA